MRRREVLGVVGGAAAWPLMARAQQIQRPRRVGALITGAEGHRASQEIAAFRDAMEKLGWADGRNIKIDYRVGNSADQLRGHAAELAGMGLDVILAGYASSLTRLKDAIRTTPIVFANVPDPIRNNFVASVTRPGGNITGFANYEVSIGAKWLELLKQIAPHVTRVGYYYDPANPAAVGYLDVIQTTAPSINIGVSAVAARTAEDLERSITVFSAEPNGGLIVAPGPLMTAYRSLIRQLSERHRLPSIYAFREDVQSGGLASYGIDPTELFRRAASYVDRILKGEKPGDLPVQYATKFHLAINLKTAKELGLEVPVSLLARTDEVIE